MKKQYLLFCLLTLNFSGNLFSETHPDFWFLPFSIVGQNPPCSISGPDYACNNSSGIIFTGPAGMASYAWSITGAGSIPGPTNEQTVSVTSGNYLNDFTLTLTVTDANNGSSTCSKIVYIFLLTPPANITINPSPACLGATIDLSIAAASSSTVAWSGEGITDPDGTFVPDGFGGFYNETNAITTTSGLHTYYVTVTSDYGCVNTGTANVTIGQPINLSTTVTNTCSGGSTGAIDLMVSDGTPAFTYNWTGGVTTQDRSNLPAGTYTVTVSDAGGCSKSISATVGSNPLPSVNFSFSPNDTVCAGTTTMITASGGTQYLWNTGATTQTLTVVPTNSSNYSVTVTNAAGCSKVSFVGLTVLSAPVINATIVQPTTCTSADGSITLITSGNSYNWSTPDGSGLINGQKNQSGLTVGTYNVTVTNFSGCTATASYVLTGPGGCDCPTIGSLSANPSPACVNQNVTLTASGLVNMGSTYGIVFKSFAAPTADPYTGGTTLATVNNNQLGGGGTSATATVTFASNGTKYLYAILTPVPSSPSCRPSATTTLNVDIIPPSITCPANATVNANASCQGQVGSYSAAALSDNCNPSPTVTQSPVSSTLLTGHNATQTVTLTANDGNGNTATCTLTVTLKDVTPPSITCPANATVNANASCQGQVGSYNASSLSDNCNPSPTVTQSPVSSTLLTGHNATQTVTLTANDGSGNTATCTLTVTLKDVTPPSITCQANVTINANASCQGTLGLYQLVGGSDNCGGSLSYGQDPSDGTIISGHNTVQVVTLTAYDAAGNSTTCTLTVTLKDVTPPSITCPANATVNANASCQGQVGSYTASSLSDNCNPSPTVTQSPVSSTLLTGHNATQTVTLTANDGNGNTSTCTLTVTLKDVTPPTVTCQGNVTINANASCQGTLGLYQLTGGSDNCAGSLSYGQDPSDGTIISGHNTVQVVTLTAYDDAGNSTTCTLTVTLKDVTPPSITCPANATVNANASCQGQVGSYNASSLSDNCNPSPTVTQSPVSSTQLTGHNATQTVTLTANDGNGNTSTCTLIVTLKDVTPPSITCPANATVNANASCQGQVGSYTATSLSDNCNPSPTVTQSPVSSTLLTGHNATQTVTLTANDGNGNTSACTLTVTLKDVTPPTVTCQGNVTINANASCQGALGLYSLSGTDNCSPSLGYTQSPSNGTIISGHNTVQVVTLTAGDDAGNTASCTLTVTLKDVTPPSITCPANATVNANASCQGQVGSYNASSLSDNCNPSPTVTQSPVSSTQLTGHNAAQTVTLTANDGNGNTSTCTLVVTLKDVTPPGITCPANATVNANASCQGQVGSYNASSLSDNCNPSPTVTQSPVSSTVLTGHNAAQTVTLTANDGNGNTSTCTLTVTLKDVTPPGITCPANATVNANASCQGQVGSYNASSLSDNCNPSPTVTQSPVSSTLLTGHNATQTVTLTANDGNGNTSACTLVVTLKDVTPPTITCPANTTVAANASCQGTVGAYSPASLSDNCNPASTVTQSPASSTVLSGHNAAQTVTLTANDGNGNTSTCTLTVTLKDVTKPNITCPANVTINANASCQGTISAFSPTALSDNCNPTPTVAQSPAAGSAISGHNTVQTVTLTATDVAGNTQTCTLTVTLKDVTPPAIVCKAYVAILDANGNVSITPANVYQSGSDNCGVVNLVSVVASSFNCSNVGNNLVTLTANDGNGNPATCSATVTVRDVTPPVAKCQNVTANLGANGTVTVPASAVNNGSTDNCSMTFTLTPNTFNCSQIGMQTVTLKATDPGGNMSTCTAKVTVRDITGPIAKCKNPTIFLDNNGHATLSAAQVNNGSTDNCGIATMSIDWTSYDCSNIGGSPSPVNLSMTDVNGNSSTCLGYVTVKDAIAPTAVCEDVTVALGPNGYAVVYSEDLAFNSTDNCSVWSYSPVAKVYTKFNLGPNNLTITVKDWSGNAATCVSVVTVILPGNGDFQQGGDGGKEVSPGTFDLLIYPNPTSGEAIMAFELPSDQAFSFRIFDTSGRMIYSHEDHGIEGENVMPLRLGDLAPGIYLIDFQSENWKVQKRLVLQR